MNTQMTETEALSKYKDVFEKTNKANPKEEDLVALREVFDVLPSLYEGMGNVQDIVFKQILGGLSTNSGFGQECMKRHIAGMKTKLGYHTSTFVEQMLIDEILMRWLRLQVMENDHKNATYQNHNMKNGMYYDKRLHLAQSRYLKAIEALAKVRKMIAATQAKGAQMFKDLMDGASRREVET